MSQEFRKQIELIKNWKPSLNENLNESININRFFINQLSEELKNKDGVIDVDVSSIQYDEDGNIYMYNNVIDVSFGNTSFFGFQLKGFNNFDASANKEKINKYLEKSNTDLDKYIFKINEIKNIIPKIKDVVDFIDSLNLENNINIKKVGYSLWNDVLRITIYKAS